jgi:hypothetical protein
MKIHDLPRQARDKHKGTLLKLRFTQAHFDMMGTHGMMSQSLYNQARKVEDLFGPLLGRLSKRITLPRQAQDKHRQTSKSRLVILQIKAECDDLNFPCDHCKELLVQAYAGKEPPSFYTARSTNDHFTKTGSGQT